MPNLDADELQKIVDSYKDEQITDQQYTFGSMMQSELSERDKRIESKASSALGWSAAILAFLFTQTPKLGGPIRASLALVIACAALTSIWFSYRVLKARAWTWPSDTDWFAKDHFESADSLKRFHLRCLHGVRRDHTANTDAKGAHLRRAEALLVAAALLLAVGVVLAITSVWAGFRF